MNIQLNKKEHTIKINMEVLESFQEDTGCEALAFSPKNVVHSKVLLARALVAGNSKLDYEAAKKIASDAMNVNLGGVVAAIYEHYVSVVVPQDEESEGK